MYNVGDKILIKSIEWYDDHKDEDGYVGDFCPRMKQYCGKVLTISKIVGNYYEMKEDNDINKFAIDESKYLFSDNMIERFVDE